VWFGFCFEVGSAVGGAPNQVRVLHNKYKDTPLKKDNYVGIPNRKTNNRNLRKLWAQKHNIGVFFKNNGELQFFPKCYVRKKG